MSSSDLYLSLIPMLATSFIVWLISLYKKDVSIVDSLWPVFFIIASLYYLAQLEDLSTRTIIFFSLILIWGIRLSAHITYRHWGCEEDHRYQTIRKNNQPGFAFKSLYLIFAFQAVIAWIIALPLYYVFQTQQPLSLLDALGVTLWLTGMLFETLADYQLLKFKQDPNNKGKILTRGLWAYSRHPNYFGESLIWWGFFCFALASGATIAIISPLLMTFLLLKFSGVSLLEKTMQTRPGYEDYMRNTNAFIPGSKGSAS